MGSARTVNIGELIAEYAKRSAAYARARDEVASKALSWLTLRETPGMMVEAFAELGLLQQAKSEYWIRHGELIDIAGAIQALGTKPPTVVQVR